MVALYVGITDADWFATLSELRPDEVNFWAPSGRNFRALQPGELFLFKLHAPNDFIVGGGVFSHASTVPLSVAWEAFGTKNGVASHQAMRERIARYRTGDELLDPRRDPVIGCRILTEPFFWPREMWLPAPKSFARQTVSGKGYETTTSDGRALWDAVVERLSFGSTADGSLIGTDERTAPNIGEPRLVRSRLGQGAFRLAVTDAYDRRCAVSGERTLPILDAAHVRPHAEGGPNAVGNGLLLRTDIHRLFDLGYVTVSSDARFEVSRRLKEDFDNGRHYYELHGTHVRSPEKGWSPPDDAALNWHRESRYLG